MKRYTGTLGLVLAVTVLTHNLSAGPYDADWAEVSALIQKKPAEWNDHPNNLVFPQHPVNKGNLK